MIRKNLGLNCVCCDSGNCPNGSDYADRIDSFTGRIFCEKIGKVAPLDLDKLNRSIEFINLLGEISSASKPVISGTKKTLTESLFEEDTKRDSDHRVCRYGETKNSPYRIRELIEMGFAVRPVKYSHRVNRTPKPLPRKMSEEETACFVRACERLETMLDGTYFDVPRFCDETAPTDATRENQSPVWGSKV